MPSAVRESLVRKASNGGDVRQGLKFSLAEA